MRGLKDVSGVSGLRSLIGKLNRRQRLRAGAVLAAAGFSLLLTGCSGKEQNAIKDAWGVLWDGLTPGGDEEESSGSEDADLSGAGAEVVGWDYSGEENKPAVQSQQGVSVESTAPGASEDNAGTAPSADPQSITASAEGDGSFPYYRSLLSESDKPLYDTMLAGLKSFETFPIDCVDDAKIEQLFYYCIGDHPEIFYVEGYETSCKELAGKRFDMEIKAKNTMTKDQALLTDAQVSREADRIISGARGASDYEKILYLHDYLIKHTDYGNTDNDQNIPSVLLRHKSVCAGYARTMQYLLNRAGIDTAYVWGKAQNRDAGGIDTHAWNLVRADGEWYYLDVTYDDANFKPENAYQSDYVRYTYFLVTGDKLFRTHEASEPATLPVCSATADNYFVREGLIFDSFDEERLRELFSQKKQSGESYVWFLCRDSVVFSEMQRQLIDEGKLTELTESDHATYYHCQSEDLTFMVWLL